MTATLTVSRQHRKTWTEEVRQELDRAMEHELRWRADDETPVMTERLSSKVS